MKREQLGQLILASEDSMYHVAKSLLYNDADCQDAIQEGDIVVVVTTHKGIRDLSDIVRY